MASRNREYVVLYALRALGKPSTNLEITDYLIRHNLYQYTDPKLVKSADRPELVTINVTSRSRFVRRFPTLRQFAVNKEGLAFLAANQSYYAQMFAASAPPKSVPARPTTAQPQPAPAPPKTAQPQPAVQPQPAASEPARGRYQEMGARLDALDINVSQFDGTLAALTAYRADLSRELDKLVHERQRSTVEIAQDRDQTDVTIFKIRAQRDAALAEIDIVEAEWRRGRKRKGA